MCWPAPGGLSGGGAERGEQREPEASDATGPPGREPENLDLASIGGSAGRTARSAARRLGAAAATLVFGGGTTARAWKPRSLVVIG
jgi:hypothetical protein